MFYNAFEIALQTNRLTNILTDNASLESLVRLEIFIVSKDQLENSGSEIMHTKAALTMSRDKSKIYQDLRLDSLLVSVLKIFFYL